MESLLKDNRTGESPPETAWVFVGSYIDANGSFLADQVGSLITNYHDNSTLIDLPLELGQVDDFMYANEAVIPPVNTEVDVRIVAQEAKGE